MPGLLVEFPRTRLIIVGEGSERVRLQELVTSLGLDKHVTLAGFRTDVPELLQRMDVYVQPSLHESFGIVLLEAMAAGLPVVASEVEGIPEIVADGETGYLVPVGDSEALANAVRSLLRDTELRRKMGETGRRRVAKEFDIKKTVRSYEQLYEELCS
jgi:glycosyltransferase involved in cell wall biosynthesis